MAHFMLENTYSASSGHLVTKMYNIFTKKHFVVTSSLCGNVHVAVYVAISVAIYVGYMWRTMK